MSLTAFDLNAPPSRDSFITRGLFPANLPSAITSAGLAAPYADEDARYLVSQNRTGNLARFDATKRGDQRRNFEIPHPLFARDAGHFFESNWEALWDHIDRSSGSASKPMRPSSGYRAIAITPQAKLRETRISKLAAKRYCLVTDISRCFPSIYTHSIPWALHGKSSAKLDRRAQSPDVWGNRLDFIHRQGQDGQTIGLPVGPDASRVTAEIVLSAIDVETLQNTRTKTSFVRHVDDYWVGGDSITECEQKLNVLRSGLNNYGLDINESKTRIVELSEVTGEYWPDDLAKNIETVFPQISFHRRAVKQSEVTDLFSRAIKIVRDTNDAAILKFLVRRMDSAIVWQDHWKKVEPFLAHIAVQFPHVFDYIARVLAWALRRNVKVDRALWREVVGTVALTSAEFGRDGELLWALWLYKELGYKVPRPIIAKALTNNGPLPIALACHLAIKGLVTNPSFFDEARARAKGPDQYSGREWPLTLELFHLGEAAELRADFPLNGSLLQKPFAEQASIVRIEAHPAVFYEDIESRENVDSEILEAPDHAIEDFTSSYDDEDDEFENPFDAWRSDEDDEPF